MIRASIKNSLAMPMLQREGAQILVAEKALLKDHFRPGGPVDMRRAAGGADGASEPWFHLGAGAVPRHCIGEDKSDIGLVWGSGSNGGRAGEKELGCERFHGWLNWECSENCEERAVIPNG